MSGKTYWPDEPAECHCTRMAVATLEETLACPYGWRLVPGKGWFHSWPPRRRLPAGAGSRRETAQATR